MSRWWSQIFQIITFFIVKDGGFSIIWVSLAKTVNHTWNSYGSRFHLSDQLPSMFPTNNCKLIKSSRLMNKSSSMIFSGISESSSTCLASRSFLMSIFYPISENLLLSDKYRDKQIVIWLDHGSFILFGIDLVIIPLARVNKNRKSYEPLKQQWSISQMRMRIRIDEAKTRIDR